MISRREGVKENVFLKEWEALKNKILSSQWNIHSEGKRAWQLKERLFSNERRWGLFFLQHVQKMERKSICRRMDKKRDKDLKE